MLSIKLNKEIILKEGFIKLLVAPGSEVDKIQEINRKINKNDETPKPDKGRSFMVD